MDIDDIRRANLRILERSAGSPKSIAEKVGMTYVQYVNTRDGAKEAKTQKPRGMRKETAWRFEDAFKMPRGWLDTPHGETDNTLGERPAAAYVHPNETTRQIVALCDATDEAGRGMALMVIQQALERYRPAKEKAA